MSRPKPKSYTNEFIDGAIKLALSSVSVERAAKDLGIPVTTLYTRLNKTKNRLSVLSVGTAGLLALGKHQTFSIAL